MMRKQKKQDRRNSYAKPVSMKHQPMDILKGSTLLTCGGGGYYNYSYGYYTYYVYYTYDSSQCFYYY